MPGSQRHPAGSLSSKARRSISDEETYGARFGRREKIIRRLRHSLESRHSRGHSSNHLSVDAARLATIQDLFRGHADVRRSESSLPEPFDDRAKIGFGRTVSQIPGLQSFRPPVRVDSTIKKKGPRSEER